VKYAVLGCLGIAFGLLGCSPETEVFSEPLYYWEVEVGDCTNIPRARRALQIVPCDQPHDAEVYAKQPIGESGEGWPGDLHHLDPNR